MLAGVYQQFMHSDNATLHLQYLNMAKAQRIAVWPAMKRFENNA
jgi:hypothetical protein